MTNAARPKPVPHQRGGYRYFSTMTTRWRDNDLYSHMNNAVYYEYFDSVVGGWLLENHLITLEDSPVIGLVVATSCDFFEPIAFPDRITAALRCARAGRSSVQYEIGLFRNDGDSAAAQGRFTHVMVDRATRQAADMPAALRAALETIAARP